MNYSTLKLATSMKIKISHDLGYHALMKEFLDHPKILNMRQYPHHGNIDCLSHCIHVSYCGYLAGQKLGLDKNSLARAGLLHDFYLYDWHKKINRKGFHGVTHPKTALTHAKQNFNVNKLEENIILTHMWPLTLMPPKYRESILIMIIDKYCALFEMFFI